MKEEKNAARVRFAALSENEGFARVVTSGFVMHYAVTPTFLADLKTMVSEAVTNAIVHGYRDRDREKCTVVLDLKYDGNDLLTVSVTDHGKGIDDIEQAMEPFFTTDKEGERSGMGLPIMKAFSDSFRIVSRPGFTKVTMKKRLS